MFKRRLAGLLTIILISSTLVINSEENKLDKLILGGRYLGVNLAKKVIDSKLTYDEYYARNFILDN